MSISSVVSNVAVLFLRYVQMHTIFDIILANIGSFLHLCTKVEADCSIRSKVKGFRN